MPLIVSRRAILEATLLIAAMSALPTIALAEDAPAAETPERLFGIEWRASGIGGSEPVGDVLPTVMLDETGSAGGNTGCNTYFATATISDDAITFSEIGSTYIACEQPIRDQEQAFLDALRATATFTLEDGQLIFFDSEGEALLTFVAVA